MKNFNFMIAFFVWMTVYFWAQTFEIRNAQDRTIWAMIFATIWGLIVYRGISDFSKNQ